MTEPAVLVVDDQPQNLTAFQVALEPLAIEVVTAASGEEAVRLTAARRFATVLMDVRMPSMDGFEAAALIRARPDGENVPILFVSAIDRELAHIERGYSAGALDYLVKPVDDRLLRAKVGVLIDLWRRAEAGRIERERGREEAEAAGRRCRAILQHLDQVPLLVWATDHSGVPYYWNRRFLECGLPAPPGSERLACLPGVAPDDRQRASEAWALALATGRPGDVAVKLAGSPDGPYLPHSLRFFPVTFETGSRGWTGLALPSDPAGGPVDRPAAGSAFRNLLTWVGHELRNPRSALKTGLALRELRFTELTDWDRMVARQLERLEGLARDLGRLDPPAAPDAPAVAGQLRILIVDDNRDAATLMAEVLRAHGGLVEVAYDGDGAIQAAARAAPDVAILDIGLPDMDGRELARRLRAQSPGGLKIYALSGFTSAADEELSRAAGFEHHFVKPVDTTQLVRAIGLVRAGSPAPGEG